MNPDVIRLALEGLVVITQSGPWTVHPDQIVPKGETVVISLSVDDPQGTRHTLRIQPAENADSHSVRDLVTFSVDKLAKGELPPNTVIYP